MSEKKTLEEKLSDFERKGNHWLELVRNWILQANQAQNLASSKKFEEMKTFLKTIGSNRHLRASALSVDFKTPFSFLAELPLTARSADAFLRGNSIGWCVINKVRTYYEQNPDAD